MQWDVILSSKGQITIPKEMRAALDLKPGDQMIYSLIDGQIVITPKNVDFNDLAGLLGKPPGGSSSLEDIDKAVLMAAGSNATDLADDDHKGVAV